MNKNKRIAQLIRLLPILLFGGCSWLGAENVLIGLAEIPSEMRENVAMCQMINGAITADGIYSNGQAEGVTLISYNGGCEQAGQIETRNGGVTLK